MGNLKKKMFFGGVVWAIFLCSCSSPEKSEIEKGWQWNVNSIFVDANINVGLMKSIVFDADCTPHVVYSDDMAGVVMYAYPANNTWAQEQVSNFDIDCFKGVDIDAAIEGPNVYAVSANACKNRYTVTFYTRDKSGNWTEEEVYSTNQEYIPDVALVFDNGRPHIYLHAVTDSHQRIIHVIPAWRGGTTSSRAVYTISGDTGTFSGLSRSLAAVVDRDGFHHLFFTDLVLQSLRHIVIDENSDRVITDERPEWEKVYARRLSFTATANGFIATIDETAPGVENVVLYRDGIPQSSDTYQIINENQLFISASVYSPLSLYTVDYEKPRVSQIRKHGRYISAKSSPEGVTYVVYTDESRGVPVVASFNNGEWVIKDLDLPGFETSPIALAVDKADLVHIFYRDTTHEDLVAYTINEGEEPPVVQRLYTRGIAGINPRAASCEDRVGIGVTAIRYFTEENQLGYSLLFLLLF